MRVVVMVLLASPPLLLTCCTTTVPQTTADAPTAQRLLHASPPDGFARLYFFDGRIVNAAPHTVPFRADELIDGIVVGGLNGGDILVVDVPAGKHVLTWRERSPDRPTSEPLTVQLQPGQRIYVSNDACISYAIPPVGLYLFGQTGLADCKPGSLMTVRPDGEEMSSGNAVVLPDANAVAQLAGQAHP
jgi:hypothetical protein